MSLQVLVGPRKAEEGPSETMWVGKVSLLRGLGKEASWIFIATPSCMVPSRWALEPIVVALGVWEEPEVLMSVFPIARDKGASRKALGGWRISCFPQGEQKDLGRQGVMANQSRPGLYPVTTQLGH